MQVVARPALADTKRGVNLALFDAQEGTSLGKVEVGASTWRSGMCGNMCMEKSMECHRVEMSLLSRESL